MNKTAMLPPHSLPAGLASSASGNLYPYFVLGMLWLVALFRFVDLQILAVLMEPIKQEFVLSDTQLALLGGLAFALFYGGLGLPVAWLADRWNRRNIIAIALALWSFMTMLCGFAGSFTSLFLARMGVGIGEAGAYPPTTALLSDYFPAQRRPAIFAVLGSAIPAGVFVGFLIGGYVNEIWGWRAAFKLVGIPGIILALAVYLFVVELPAGAGRANGSIQRNTNLLRTLLSLCRIPSYRFLVGGACLFTMGAYGSGVWIPSWFIRHHGFTVSEIGLWMAFLYGGGGLIGTLTGGWLAGYCSKRWHNEACHMNVCALSLLLVLPFAGVVFIWPDPEQALCFHLGVTILMHMNIGPVLAMVQKLAQPHQRAQAQALNVLVSNLLALPLGPLFVGIVSDTFTDSLGTRALGYGILLLMLLCYTCAALCFYRSGRLLQ